MRHRAARPFAAALVALAAACAVSTACARATPAGPDAPASAAEQVVERQLEAYNRHDVDAFAATYAPDARGYAHPDRPMFAGQAELRASYGRFFAAAPAARARVLRRIVEGPFVVDHEEVTGLPAGFPGAPSVRAVAVYEVRGGRIASVRLLQ